MIFLLMECWVNDQILVNMIFIVLIIYVWEFETFYCGLCVISEVRFLKKNECIENQFKFNLLWLLDLIREDMKIRW